MSSLLRRLQRAGNRAPRAAPGCRVYALDLEADTDLHLKLLKQLREDLAMKHAIGQGAYSVARERFDAASRRTEALLRQVGENRQLLTDLRATLNEMRKTVSGEL